MIGDVLSQYFPFGTPPFEQLGQTWRRMFFEEAVKVGLNLVTTVAWRFDVPADGDTIRSWLHPYAMSGRVCCVELQAPLEVRQERNKTEHRRRLKNAYWVTEAYLEEIHRTYCYDSQHDFPLNYPYLRLETEHLPASAAASRIVDRFNLSRLENS